MRRTQGFRKLPSPQYQEFAHPCFKRGQPHLLTQICRGTIPGGAHAADGPAQEIEKLKSQASPFPPSAPYNPSLSTAILEG